LDFLHVLKDVIHPDFTERQRPSRRDAYPVNYFNEKGLIAREALLPLVDAKEIRARQGAVKELIENQQTWEKLGRWVDLRGRYLSGDGRDTKLARFYKEALSDFHEIESSRRWLDLVKRAREGSLTAEERVSLGEEKLVELTRVDETKLVQVERDRGYATTRLLAKARHFDELPKILSELAAVSEAPEGVRWAQLKEQAGQLAKAGVIEKFRQQLKEAGYEPSKEQSSYTPDQFEAIAAVFERISESGVGSNRSGEGHGWINEV